MLEINVTYLLCILIAGCTDNKGNARTAGERWDEPCGVCVCVNGNAICPIPSCAPQPHPLCTVNESEETCCPTYTCPDGTWS